MEPPVRIELTTFRLQGGCSTTELGRPFLPAHYVSAQEIDEILGAEQLRHGDRREISGVKGSYQ